MKPRPTEGGCHAGYTGPLGISGKGLKAGWYQLESKVSCIYPIQAKPVRPDILDHRRFFISQRVVMSPNSYRLALTLKNDCYCSESEASCYMSHGSRPDMVDGRCCLNPGLYLPR